MGEKRLRILLADDQILFVESLKSVLEDKAPDFEVVGIAHQGMEAITMALKLRPDIVLMDVRMPILDGVQAARKIHDKAPEVKIVMLTTFTDDAYAKVAIRFGAIGYLLKNIGPEDLIRSIRTVRQGITQISPEILATLMEPDNGAEPFVADPLREKLTPRENEILDLLLASYDNKAIAQALSIGDQTVRNQIHSIYEKTGINNRLDLIRTMNTTKKV